jgi:hypothetical protein
MNWEMIEGLSAVFQKRYEPNFAWGNVVSMFSMLPGLRAFWPMSAHDNSSIFDLSGQGRTLTRNVVSSQWINLFPTGRFDAATTRYLNRATETGLEILGTESNTSAAYRGLTVGGWLNPDSTVNLAGYMAKYTNVAATSAFALHQSTAVADAARFVIYNGGVAYPALSAASAVTPGAWHFIVGRFVPSTSVSVFTDGVFVDNLVGVPASITNSPSDFEIGRLGGALVYYTGYGSLFFLCAMGLSNTWISMLYEHSRPLFGG